MPHRGAAPDRGAHATSTCRTSCSAAASRSWSPALLRARPKRSAAAASSSRSRPMASASTPRSPSGWRDCRCARCRSVSTATRRRSTQRQRPGGVARQGARRLPRGARGRLCPSKSPSRPTRLNIHEARSGHRARPGARGVSLQYRQLMRIGTAARLWERARAERANSTVNFSPCSSAKPGLEAGAWNSATVLLDRAGWVAGKPAGAAGDAARSAQWAGEGCGGTAAHLCRSAAGNAGGGLGRPTAGRGGTRWCSRRCAPRSPMNRVTRKRTLGDAVAVAQIQPAEAR